LIEFQLDTFFNFWSTPTVNFPEGYSMRSLTQKPTLAQKLHRLWVVLLQTLDSDYFDEDVKVIKALCINSLAHTVGSRRFETDDDSRNSLFLAVISLGEGWHNNHHRYMNSARQGFYWWEIDVTYYLLKMLSWTGLIWDLRPVPASAFTGEKRAKIKSGQGQQEPVRTNDLSVAE
jgi:hypothetical protein